MRDKSEIRKDVKANTDTIDRIIGPNDLIHQDIDSWDNVDISMLETELHESMDEWHFQANHPYENAIHELAVILYIEDMQRIPINHLNFNSRDKCVIEGYWLFDMDNQEVRDRVNENWEDIEYVHEYESSAQMTVESWIMDKYLENIE